MRLDVNLVCFILDATSNLVSLGLDLSCEPLFVAVNLRLFFSTTLGSCFALLVTIATFRL
jgi:hypothetical protein